MVLVKSLKSGAKLFLLPSSRPRVLAWGALSDRARSRSRYRFPGLQQKPSVVAFALFFFSPSDTLLTSNGKSSRTSTITITRTIQGSDAHPPDQPINRFVWVDKLLSSPSSFGRGRWRNRGSGSAPVHLLYLTCPQTANLQRGRQRRIITGPSRRARYRFPRLLQKPSVVAFALFFFSPSDTLLTSNGKSSRTSTITITRTIQGSDAHPPDQPINRFVRVDKLLSSPSNFGRGRWRNRGSDLPSASSIFDLSPTANPQSSSSFVVVLVLEFWPGRREIVSSDPKIPSLHHSITPALQLSLEAKRDALRTPRK
jgi:hypothetical protein